MILWDLANRATVGEGLQEIRYRETWCAMENLLDNTARIR